MGIEEWYIEDDFGEDEVGDVDEHDDCDFVTLDCENGDWNASDGVEIWRTNWFWQSM